MMATWLKPTWWPGDYDRATDAFTHGAIPPGIYCEDEASFEALAKHPDVTRPHGAFRQSCSDPEGRWWPAIYVGGYLVRIGTPAQIEILKAVEAKSPDEVLAEQQAALDRAAAEIDSLIANMAPKPAPRSAAPPPATRHPFHGANRQQRRAAEARARRRA